VLALAACRLSDMRELDGGDSARAPQQICLSRTEGTTANSVERRDSIGIEIVENWIDIQSIMPIQPTVATVIAPDPSDAANLSGRVVDAVLLGNGSVVLGDALTSSLALFDSTGSFLRLLGKQGEGPGEYRRITRVLKLRGDTIAVVDFDQGRRMTRLLADGTLIDTHLLPMQPLASPDPRIQSRMGDKRYVAGVMNDGALLGLIRTNYIQTPPGRGNARLESDSIVLQRMNIGSGAATVLERLPNSIWWFYESNEGTTWNRLAPLSPHGYVATGGRGFYYSWGDRYEVNEYDSHGRLLRIVRVCLGRAVVTASIVDRYRRQFQSQVPERHRKLAHDAFDAAQIPEVTPALSSMLEDGFGSIWLGEFRLDDEPQVWRVVSPTGQVIATVETPAGVRLVEVGPNHMLGVKTDTDDLQTVLVYRWNGPSLRR